MNCGLFFITVHLELLLALFSNFWSFWPDGDCFVLCCHIIQNESCRRSHHPRKKYLENRGYVERVPHDPFWKGEQCVCQASLLHLRGRGWEAEGGQKPSFQTLRANVCWVDNSRVNLMPFLSSQGTNKCAFSYLAEH